MSARSLLTLLGHCHSPHNQTDVHWCVCCISMAIIWGQLFSATQFNLQFPLVFFHSLWSVPGFYANQDSFCNSMNQHMDVSRHITSVDWLMSSDHMFAHLNKNADWGLILHFCRSADIYVLLRVPRVCINADFVLLRKTYWAVLCWALLAGSGRSRWPGGDLLSHLPPVIRSLWLDIVQGYGSINTQPGGGEETDCVCLLPASFCTCRVVFNTWIIQAGPGPVSPLYIFCVHLSSLLTFTS